MLRRLFPFSKDDLPPVVKDGPSKVILKGKNKGREITYYAAGQWVFSDSPEEDGTLEGTRQAILAHIAWFNFLSEKHRVDSGE